jgi:hypothetical protein
VHLPDVTGPASPALPILAAGGLYRGGGCLPARSHVTKLLAEYLTPPN